MYAIGNSETFFELKENSWSVNGTKVSFDYKLGHQDGSSIKWDDNYTNVTGFQSVYKAVGEASDKKVYFTLKAPSNDDLEYRSHKYELITITG